jgi:hypothetical protein
MLCSLQAYGNDFRADNFLAGVTLPQSEVFRRGDNQFLSETHLIVTVSEKERLSDQINDAISFLKLYKEAIKRLLNYPGVEEVCLTFSIQQGVSPYEKKLFPNELCELALSNGISLNIFEQNTSPKIYMQSK